MTREVLQEQLIALGLRRGSTLLVHAAFSKIAPVDGGPHGLIAALQSVLGPEGTLVMPSMSDDDHPFDPRRSPCIGMGIVAQTFWQIAGVLRSNSPHAFAASGPAASKITAPHPIGIPHGVDSPAGRLVAFDAYVLLLGVGHDANTTIHVAENIAGVRYGIWHHAEVLIEGTPTRYAYKAVDHCCRRFALMDQWLDARDRQRHGTVGYAQARLARSRDIVETALEHIRQAEEVFLDAPGTCQECDAAQAGTSP